MKPGTNGGSLGAPLRCDCYFLDRESNMMRMQRLGWMSGVAMAAVAFATMASAADLPTRKAPPAPMVPMAPPLQLDRLLRRRHGRRHLGSGNTRRRTQLQRQHARQRSTFRPRSAPAPAAGEGGGEVGYNYQIGSAVLGVEDDLQWVTNSKSATFTGATVPAARRQSDDDAFDPPELARHDPRPPRLRDRWPTIACCST